MDSKKVSSFRERFTELIEESPKSRTVIAQEFHVAKQTISAWITGQTSPRMPVVISLADYFDVNPGWLLGFDVPKTVDHEAMRRYEQYYHDTINAQHDLGLVSLDESNLVRSYRALSPRGKTLLLERAEELKLLYGKKSEDDPAVSV